MRLNLGCGKNWKEHAGYEGVDILNFGQKYVIDIAKDGLQGILSNSVEHIIAFNFFEHIAQDRVIFVMNECHRVLKQDCEIHIRVPPADHAIEAFSDPTHLSTWTYVTFRNYFCGKSPRNADYGIKKWCEKRVKTISPGQLEAILCKC